jgi:hypothetical protein
MNRTRVRPLPEGRLSPLEALVFATAVTVAGLGYLGAFVGGLALLVTAATTVLYLFAYTPLKLRTPLCTIIGAVPGALPPVTGWVASREGFGLGAWVLFGILFLWQLPHTLAIARLYRDDYARAGVRLLPVVDVGRNLDRAADRHRLPRIARGQPAADLDRPGGPLLLRRRLRARRGVRRARRAAGALAVTRLGPARPVCVLALLADPVSAARVRQGMTSDARNRQILRIILTIVGALIVSSFLVGIRW